MVGATLNSMAYGYDVGVTPLQLALPTRDRERGDAMKPYVVKALIDENKRGDRGDGAAIGSGA